MALGPARALLSPVARAGAKTLPETAVCEASRCEVAAEAPTAEAREAAVRSERAVQRRRTTGLGGLGCLATSGPWRSLRDRPRGPGGGPSRTAVTAAQFGGTRGGSLSNRIPQHGNISGEVSTEREQQNHVQKRVRAVSGGEGPSGGWVPLGEGSWTARWGRAGHGG